MNTTTLMPSSHYKSPKPFKRENAGDRRPFKPKAWTHQDELKSLVGKKVRIIFSDTRYVGGRLLNADQFTLQLQHDDKSVMTYFKSAMRGFSLAVDA